MIDNVMLFERLAEPYLVLDGELSPVAANAAWRARFGNPLATANSEAGCRLELDERHRDLIRSIAGGLTACDSRQSAIVSLDTKANAQCDDHCQHGWQVAASFIPATPSQPALVALRYDEVTTLTPGSKESGPEKTVMHSSGNQRTPTGRPHDHGAIHTETALGLAGLGTWRIDVATGGIECSERCLLDLGADRPASITGQQLLGESPTEVAANWQELKHGRPVELELRLTSSSAHRWLLVRGVGQFDDNRSLRFVIGFTLDITARKEHELELDALANEERSGRERSDALARTTDQFIASVSHELRSPLNAIVSWGELLKLAADPSHVARAGEAIRRNGRQLAHMVDDLLDSGAIATGKLSVSLQPVDLGALAAIVAEDVSKLAQHKNLQLRAPDISPCIVMADESRVMQIVWNLLINAVKFTDAGHIHVSVKAVDGHAELVVRDTGRGIDAEALPFVFDRFQQIAPQSSGRVSGLGLGLWLTRHIVSLHNGTIAVTSAGRGLGTTFTVRLPLASAG